MIQACFRNNEGYSSLFKKAQTRPELEGRQPSGQPERGAGRRTARAGGRPGGQPERGAGPADSPGEHLTIIKQTQERSQQVELTVKRGTRETW